MKQPLSPSDQQVAPTRRVRGRPFPPGVSGNPLGRRVKSQRFVELYDGLAEPYGGPERLTTFQRVMLAQAVRLLMRAERTRDADMAVRLTNAGCRALAAVQSGPNPRKPVPPKPPVPSLAEHLARTAEGNAP